MSATKQFGTAGFTTGAGANVGEENIFGSDGRVIGVNFQSIDKTIFGLGQAAAKPYVQNTGKGILTPGTPGEQTFLGVQGGTSDTWSNPNMWYFNPPQEFFNSMGGGKDYGGDGGGWTNPNTYSWDQAFGSYGMADSGAGSIDPGEAGPGFMNMNIGGMSGGGGYSPKYFSSEADLWNALNGSNLFTYEGANFAGTPDSGGALRSMNTYGQMLAGDKVVTDATSWRDRGQNTADGGGPAAGPITGRKALAGSEPVIENGKVVGYRINMNHPWGEQILDTHGEAKSNSILNWGPNDKQLFAQQTQDMGDGYRFLPVANMDAFTGFAPQDKNGSYDFQEIEKKGGMFGGLGGVLGIAAMLGKFVPGPWTPFAYGYSALQALESKDPFKMAGSALGAFGGDLFGGVDMGAEDFLSSWDPSSFDVGADGFSEWAPDSLASMDSFGGEGYDGYIPTDYSGGNWGNYGAYDSVVAPYDGWDAGMQPLSMMDRIGNSLSTAWDKTSGLDLGKAAMSIGSGIYGMNQRDKLLAQMKKQSQGSDPWGSSGGRALADSQLQQLMRDPSQVSSRDPSYTLRMQGAQRANILRGSGAMAVAGANASTDWYNQRMQALGGLAGAPGDPSAPGRMTAASYGMGNDLASQSLASIGYGMSRLGGAGQDMPPEVQQWLMRQQMGARG